MYQLSDSRTTEALSLAICDIDASTFFRYWEEDLSRLIISKHVEADLARLVVDADFVSLTLSTLSKCT